MTEPATKPDCQHTDFYYYPSINEEGWKCVDQCGQLMPGDPPGFRPDLDRDQIYRKDAYSVGAVPRDCVRREDVHAGTISSSGGGVENHRHATQGEAGLATGEGVLSLAQEARSESSYLVFGANQSRRAGV